MRSVTTIFLWLVTTVLLTAAVPVLWVQQHLVDQTGYVRMAQQAASNPELQSAMASALATQVGRLSPNADATVVGGIAHLYTASSSFPAQFGQANALAHRWLFTDTVGSTVDGQGRWVIDFAPMLSDAAFGQTLREYNITVPTTVPLPVTDNAPAGLRPGALREVGRWGPWLSWGLVATVVVLALLTLLAARSRGKALTALGVSAVLVGAAGWAAIEFARPPLQGALDNTSGTVRMIADGIVATTQNSMHQWLNVTLTVGGGLVVVGVLVSLMAGLVTGRSE